MADKSIVSGAIMARLLGEYPKNDYVANNFDMLYYKEMLSGPYTCHDGNVIKGIDVDGEMLNNICWDNAIRRDSETPQQAYDCGGSGAFSGGENPAQEVREREQKTLIEEFSK